MGLVLKDSGVKNSTFPFHFHSLCLLHFSVRFSFSTIPSLSVCLSLSLHLKPDEKPKWVCHRDAPSGDNGQMLESKESTKAQKLSAKGFQTFTPAPPPAYISTQCILDHEEGMNYAFSKPLFPGLTSGVLVLTFWGHVSCSVSVLQAIQSLLQLYLRVFYLYLLKIFQEHSWLWHTTVFFILLFSLSGTCIKGKSQSLHSACLKCNELSL